METKLARSYHDGDNPGVDFVQRKDCNSFSQPTMINQVFAYALVVHDNVEELRASSDFESGGLVVVFLI